MKEYPSIQGSSKAPHKPCIAFEKYDGNNLRGEWTKKRGFAKFGTRERLFDITDPDVGSAIKLFRQSLEEPLCRVFKDHKSYRNESKITVFFEYFGPKSFVGVHTENLPTDVMECRLFDVISDKYGIIGPRDFIKHFGHLEYAARVVYEGNLNQSFIQDVREGKYQVNEGVVCKGGSGGHDWWAAKIKTNAYLEKLKRVYSNGWEAFWE